MDMLLFLFTVFCTGIVTIILAVQFIRFIFKRRRLPKKTFIIWGAFAIISITSGIYVTYFFSFDQIDRTYKEGGPQQVLSPNGQKSASVYYEPYGGAAGGVNVWVEVTNEQTKEMKVVYYADAHSTTSLSWESEETLFIRNEDPTYENTNASISLQVDKDIFDEFGRACRSWTMKNEYEHCYSSTNKQDESL